MPSDCMSTQVTLHRFESNIESPVPDYVPYSGGNSVRSAHPAAFHARLEAADQSRRLFPPPWYPTCSYPCCPPPVLCDGPPTQ